MQTALLYPSDMCMGMSLDTVENQIDCTHSVCALSRTCEGHENIFAEPMIPRVTFVVESDDGFGCLHGSGDGPEGVNNTGRNGQGRIEQLTFQQIFGLHCGKARCKRQRDMEVAGASHTERDE